MTSMRAESIGLTDSQIIERTESAFLPLRCVAEIWDYQKKLRFRTFDKSDSKVVTFPNETLALLRSGNTLDDFLNTAREAVDKKRPSSCSAYSPQRPLVQ